MQAVRRQACFFFTSPPTPHPAPHSTQIHQDPPLGGTALSSGNKARTLCSALALTDSRILCGGQMQAGSLGGSAVLKEARWRGSLAISWCSWSNSGEEVGFLGHSMVQLLA